MGLADRSVLERISTLSLHEESFKFSRLIAYMICGDSGRLQGCTHSCGDSERMHPLL